jgi:hypothetical protein
MGGSLGRWMTWGKGEVTERLIFRCLGFLGVATVWSEGPGSGRAPSWKPSFGFWVDVPRSVPGITTVSDLRGGFGRGLLHPSQSKVQ